MNSRTQIKLHIIYCESRQLQSPIFYLLFLFMKCIYCKYFRIVHAIPHVNTLKVSVTLNVCPQSLGLTLCISRWLMLEPVCSFNRAVAAYRATISTHCLIPRNMKHVAVVMVTLRLFWCQFVLPQNKPFRH